MSFQLTIQLPPGQCWKVIQQTNTKLVCALLQQLQFNDLPLTLCTIVLLCKCLDGVCYPFYSPHHHFYNVLIDANPLKPF